MFSHLLSCLLGVLVVAMVLRNSCLAQSVVLVEAPTVQFPSSTDSNSPCHWDGDTFYILNSQGHPFLSSGPDQFRLGKPIRCEFDNVVNGGRWIECTWKADDGTLYGWYHFEPRGVCPDSKLTAPKIGAAKSTDNGLHWTDLGIIIDAPLEIDCGAKNGFFAGGNGDFSCMLDAQKRFMYFFISTYAGDLSEQGVAVARMAWIHRDNPVGKVWKYYNGKWDSPGIGGRVTAIFPAKIGWVREDADAFCGPAVYWNTHLECYVMLLNRTRYKPGWPQEGIYISFSKDIGDPKSWMEPKKILDGGSWYPQVIGLDVSRKETDKLVGRRARFYMHGRSTHEIVFLKEGEKLVNTSTVSDASRVLDECVKLASKEQ